MRRAAYKFFYVAAKVRLCYYSHPNGGLSEETARQEHHKYNHEMISASHNEPPYKWLEKVVALLVVVFAGCRTQEPLALWNETAPAKNTLVEYVRAVTDED